MAIKTTTAYVDSDGVVHASLDLAQRAELSRVFKGSDGVGSDYTPYEVVTDILTYRDKVLAILGAAPEVTQPLDVTQQALSAPKRRLSLTCVLDRCRRVDLTDDQIAARVADGTITKVPKIGDASVVLLKEWAAAYRPAPAPPEVATAAFEQMRDVVDHSGSELREAVNAA